MRITMGIILTSLLMAGCGPRLSKEQYIQAMTELGCNMASEGSAEAAELFKKQGITAEDITEFRKKSKAPLMMEVATAIAKNVAKCHGVTLPD